MPSREFVENLVDYMKKNRSQTLKQNCKHLGISVQTYYKLCKKHSIDGKIGQKESFLDEETALKLMKQKVKFEEPISGILKHKPDEQNG